MKELAFWKEINSRLPDVRNAFHEFFKWNDGSGSLFPEAKDKRNSITLFMQSKDDNGKKEKKRFVDPSVDEINVSSSGGNIAVNVNKKKFSISWNGNISCIEKDDRVGCKVDGNPVYAWFSDAKKGLRHKPRVKKALKHAVQSREKFTASSIDLWSEPKTNVSDINQVALFGSSAILMAGSIAGMFIPALGILTISSPMLVGATALANGEATVRNVKGEWFINGEFGDDKWINDVKFSPSKVDSVSIKQDDEFYFHSSIRFTEPVQCIVQEESDLLSIYPKRRLECG